jgi:hypothetical protein
MENNNSDHKELMELKHEAVPGYKKVFYAAFALGLIYLGLIFTFGRHFFEAGGH